MKLQYITRREVPNSKGEIKGKVMIVKYKEEEFARVKYKCPECGYEGELQIPFKKPFIFKCEKCGFKFKIISLRAEIKKEMKKK
ncbi:MAG: hypothetical protein B6U78_01125 [Candidatus Aenigmarchaeota archaeon ex4484_224]|nr:MAG: hypothetical protein B6U78_01125 [Candidatus Aenigmarchaeota archaeon ex4484_224]